MSIIDVGTGAGALLPFYREAGIDLSGVLGVDLSSAMLANVEATYPRYSGSLGLGRKKQTKNSS